MKLAPLFLALTFAATSSAAARRSSPPADASPERIAELIEQLDGAGMEKQVRAKHAYQELKEIGKPAAPQLLKALHHKSPWIRLWSAAALASMGERRAVTPMLKLLKDPHSTLRVIVTYHISAFASKDKRIAPALVEQLADPTPDVRKWAEKALLRIKLRGAEDALKKMVRQDPPEARTSALKLLLQNRSHDIPADIKKAMASEDWRERSAGVRVIGEALIHANEDTFDMLLGALDDPNDEVKADAVEVLTGVLAQIMQRMPDDLRTKVLAELDRKLPACVESENPRLRGAAMYLLSAQTDRRDALYPVALKALDSPDPVLRVFAFKTLGRCGRKTWTLVDKAVANLNHENAEVRNTAYAVLRWATGAQFDYKPGAPEEARTQAIESIKKTLAEKRNAADTQP